VLDKRGQLLRAAVGFAGCSMPSYDRALHALHAWLDSWSGIGHVASGAVVNESEVLRNGAYAFLPMPVRIEELLTTVHRALAQRRT
jgi:DNA-binding NtrC family response regulator